MALHARRQIVQAVAARLAGLPLTGSRVYAGRAAPKASGSTPFLLVYGRREQSAPMTMGRDRRALQRELTLAIEAVTASADDNDDQVDAIALEVERAMAADPHLGGLCRDLYLVSTALDARADGESRMGRARFEFTIIYITPAADPAA